ncbi:MAG: DUF1538 domain-containing protein [Mariprofundales bacterium]|nr:DUF1538 domain-containing protein [Mariprofundales bacterium]
MGKDHAERPSDASPRVTLWRRFPWRALQMVLQPLFNAMRDLAPIIGVILFFQTVVLHRPIPNLAGMLEGLALVLVGLALFVRGLEIGLFPLSEAMAHSFASKGSAFWLLIFAFLLGFSTTIAEPALIIIAGKAAAIAAGGDVIASTPQAIADYALHLRLVVAFSVGVAIVLGVLRIMINWPLQLCILAGYGMVTALTMIAPASIIGIAYDSGGVTTSTITVPLVTALGVGLASSLHGRNPLLDGFGLIAFASLLPIIFVLLYGIIIH